MQSDVKIVVLGLGYVGLPLAVALAKSFDVCGLDVDSGRIAELRRHHDRTNEVAASELSASSLVLTDHPEDCAGADLYIVTVPTPVDLDNQPDLGPLLAASATVARLIRRETRPVVVYESTVYPGVTEEICGPRIEELSGLRAGEDFFLGYSPERINPGDREHSVERIVKVISGQTEEVTDLLARVYGAITSEGVFRAASIKAAEAAKVIENAQRDINIAFMNEIAQIFAKMDISIWDVLEAAGTKWNFLPFQPGLVGGHCIGVDPYYLSHRAQALGHQPQVILAGRATNDGMGKWVADGFHSRLNRASARILVLGLTFKENVPDLRNSKIADVIARLGELGHEVTVHDPLAAHGDAMEEYGIDLKEDALERRYDAVLLAVPHEEYTTMPAAAIRSLVAPSGTIGDLKGVWRDLDLGADIGRWQL